jgi:hypothetical protein
MAESKQLHIRVPQTLVEYKAACTLIEAAYQQHGYVEYFEDQPRWSSLLAAMDQHEIVGCVAMEVAEERGRLPVETYFNFSVETTMSCPRHRVVEICRLTNRHPNDLLSVKALVLGLVQYAFVEHEFAYGLACMKPALLAILQRYLHIPVRVLPHHVSETAVPIMYKGYFCGEPRPVLATIDRRDVDQYVAFLHAEILNSARIELIGFDPASRSC